MCTLCGQLRSAWPSQRRADATPFPETVAAMLDASKPRVRTRPAPCRRARKVNPQLALCFRSARGTFDVWPRVRRGSLAHGRRTIAEPGRCDGSMSTALHPRLACRALSSSGPRDIRGTSEGQQFRVIHARSFRGLPATSGGGDVVRTGVCPRGAQQGQVCLGTMLPSRTSIRTGAPLAACPLPLFGKRRYGEFDSAAFGRQVLTRLASVMPTSRCQ